MRLRELRQSRSFYQKDVAAMLGVDRTTYVKYENESSEPPIDTLIKLCRLYEVTMDYLIGISDNPSPSSSSPLSEPEREYLNLMNMLNESGISLVIDYIHMLSSRQEYRKEESGRLAN